MATKKTTTPTRKTARNPEATLSSVKTDIKDAVHSATDTAVAAFDAARTQGENAISAAVDAGGAAVHSGQDMVTTAHSDFTDLVKKNPTAMVVGALGVGVLVGLAMRGRS